MFHLGRRILARTDHVLVRRGGFRWALDLDEGIDFSIYLLGSFEPRTIRSYPAVVRSGNTVIDIGANIGSHTLPLAKCVGSTGKVIAFEPTEYAFRKLQANLELNGELRERVVAEQIFLVADGEGKPAPTVYSSWPLVAEQGRHPLHLGMGMSTQGAGAETLDAYLARKGIAKVDFIKIDVDGYEATVLRGARVTLERNRPKIMMEFAPYLAEEAGESFVALIDLLTSLNYRAREVNTGRAIDLNSFRKSDFIGAGSSVNVLLEAG
jgi:FkbM family methyltransferase